MLHIILLILKILGIILAIILGILVLLILIVCFVPIRYRITGECDGKLEGLKINIKISWLLHLLGAYVKYDDRTLRWRIRFAWKKMSSEDETKTRKPIEEATEKVSEEPISIEPIIEEPVREEPIIDAVEDSFITEEKPEKEEKAKKTEKQKKRWNGFWKNIKYTIEQICDKIKMLIQKKDHLMEFLTAEIHVKAFKKLKVELIKFMKRQKPKKFIMNALIGFEDPCTTGQVLAGYSILYPWVGEHAVLKADFEKQIFEGTLLLRGRIYGITLVALAWRLIMSKEVRTTLKDFRQFSL